MPFFDILVQAQPPDQPNTTIASPLTPGNGYAPSIPYIKDKEVKGNIKDILMLAKAGMLVGDIQKEAHLSFLMALIYDQQKKYKEALEAYKKFLHTAKIMEDKIGMALAANRISVCYFNLKNYQKSLEYILINIKLSDNDNLYSGVYNIGIIYRALQQYDNALVNF